MTATQAASQPITPSPAPPRASGHSRRTAIDERDDHRRGARRQPHDQPSVGVALALVVVGGVVADLRLRDGRQQRVHAERQHADEQVGRAEHRLRRQLGEEADADEPGDGRHAVPGGNP